MRKIGSPLLFLGNEKSEVHSTQFLKNAKLGGTQMLTAGTNSNSAPSFIVCFCFLRPLIIMNYLPTHCVPALLSGKNAGVLTRTKYLAETRANPRKLTSDFTP